jgi:hypothetical protein
MMGVFVGGNECGDVRESQRTLEVSYSARERRAACNEMNEKPKNAKLQARGAVGCTDLVGPTVHDFSLK